MSKQKIHIYQHQPRRHHWGRAISMLLLVALIVKLWWVLAIFMLIGWGMFLLLRQRPQHTEPQQYNTGHEGWHEPF